MYLLSLSVSTLKKLVHHFRSIIPSVTILICFHCFQHIDFALTSPYGGGRSGRVKRKRAKAAAAKDAGGDEDEDEE